MTGARFVLSLDCEMMWGSHYIGGLKRFPYVSGGFEKYYDELLDLFARFEVRSTFAFVAGIALNAREFETAASGCDSPFYRRWIATLLPQFPGAENLWFAPGIIRKVAEHPLKHEIASHSLTHLAYRDGCDEASCFYEMTASFQILKRFTDRLHTYIFPENRFGCLDSFAKSGYRIYRSSTEKWYASLPAKRAGHFLDQSIPVAPPSAKVQRDEFGNLCVSDSHMMFQYDGVRGFIPHVSRVAKMKRGLDRAVREGGVFHLWLHPWHLGSSPNMLKSLGDFFEHLSLCRRKGLVEVMTMGDIADAEIR